MEVNLRDQLKMQNLSKITNAVNIDESIGNTGDGNISMAGNTEKIDMMNNEAQSEKENNLQNAVEKEGNEQLVDCDNVTKRKDTDFVRMKGKQQMNEDIEESLEVESFHDFDYQISDNDDQMFEEFVDEGLEDFDQNVSIEVRRQNRQKRTRKRDIFAKTPHTNVGTLANAIASESCEPSDLRQDEHQYRGTRTKKAFKNTRKQWLYQLDSEIDLFDGEKYSVSEISQSKNLDDNFYNSHSSSDENENYKRQKMGFPKFRMDRDMVDPTFKEGMIFNTKSDLRAAIIEHGIKWGRQLYFKKNDDIRVRVACKSELCEWTIYAQKVGNTPTF